MVYSAGWLYGVPIHRRRRVHWVQSTVPQPLLPLPPVPTLQPCAPVSLQNCQVTSFLLTSAPLILNFYNSLPLGVYSKISKMGTVDTRPLPVYVA